MQIRNPEGPPSAPQVSFLERLVNERQISAATASADLATLREWLASGANKGQVDTLIKRFKGLPRRQGASIEIGMYVTADERIFRVYKARSGMYLLVKRLDGSDAAGWSYTYIGPSRALNGLKGLRKMTLEEAKGWGKKTGTCCVCAAHLTDGESIDKGIGPVCERSFR